MAIARQYLHHEELPAALVTSRAELTAASGAIADLAAAASDANPFFEPAFLVPSLELVKDDWAVFLAGDAGNRLIGLFPFARTRTAPGFEALTSLVLPHSQHGYLGTPLLRAGREAEAIDGLLDALELGALGYLLLDFRLLARNSAAYAALRGRLAARGQPWIELGRRDRAMFRPRESAEAYLSAALSPAKRRKLGQRQRQARAAGPAELPPAGAGRGRHALGGRLPGARALRLEGGAGDGARLLAEGRALLPPGRRRLPRRRPAPDVRPLARRAPGGPARGLPRRPDAGGVGSLQDRLRRGLRQAVARRAARGVGYRRAARAAAAGGARRHLRLVGQPALERAAARPPRAGPPDGRPAGPRRPGAGRGAAARPAEKGEGGARPPPPGRLSPAPPRAKHAAAAGGGA